MKKNHWQTSNIQEGITLSLLESPNISQEDLEDNIIQILKSKPEDIEPCYRLDYVKNESKNNPKRTIVKFLNRKNCENSMKNRIFFINIDKSKLGYNKETSILINHCWRI